MVKRNMEIQRQYMHDVKRPSDPRKSAQVKLQIKHLHGTEDEQPEITVHAQYFALFVYSFSQRIHEKKKGAF